MYDAVRMAKMNACKTATNTSNATSATEIGRVTARPR